MASTRPFVAARPAATCSFGFAHSQTEGRMRRIVNRKPSCLSNENDHKMRGLDFREIQPRNNVFVSGNKSRPRTVWTANKLKAYENQTKQTHGGSPSVSESGTHQP